MRILLVEDKRIAGWLGKALRRERYVVDSVHCGEDAYHVLSTEQYSVVILELTGPKIDGLRILAQLRALDSVVPVIVLSANDSRDERIALLDAGADDYLVMPFDMGELAARIRVQLRRANFHKQPIVLCGRLAFDSNAQHFSVSGEPLELTSREHAVLETLIFRAGATVRKRALAMNVFGFDDEAQPNAIEVYIHRVRKKLAGSGVAIVTRRGLGYVLKEASGIELQSAAI